MKLAKEYSNEEIMILKRALKEGARRCKKDHNMDECSFGYETGVLITGNDALYLVALMEKLPAKEPSI
jgi:hypothetical protein